MRPWLWPISWMAVSVDSAPEYPRPMAARPYESEPTCTLPTPPSPATHPLPQNDPMLADGMNAPK